MVLGYLRGLVVYWQHCNIKTDSSGSSTLLTGHRQHKLNMLRIRSNILERRHISHFHVVDSMLVGRNKVVSICIPLNSQTVRKGRNLFFFLNKYLGEKSKHWGIGILSQFWDGVNQEQPPCIRSSGKHK